MPTNILKEKIGIGTIKDGISISSILGRITRMPIAGYLNSFKNFNRSWKPTIQG